MMPLMETMEKLVLDLNLELPIFLDGSPEKPTNQINILEYSGGDAYKNDCALRNLQINVRHADYEQARTICGVLYKALAHDETGLLVEGRYLLINRRQSPFLRTRSEQNVCTFTFNVTVLTPLD